MAPRNAPASAPFESVASLSAQRPTGRPKVAEAIISDIRSAIASGELQLGARLPNEKELARHFGVSQPTIREAVRALDAMGLVEVRHGSGAFVANNVNDYVYNTLQTLMQMQRVGVFEVLEIRELLGVYSASRAAAEASPEDLAAIEKAEEECRLADTVVGMAQAVISFQAACSAAAHKPLMFAIETFLIKILMQLELTAEGNRGAKFWRDQTARFVAHRANLMQKIKDGDSSGASDAMRAYIQEQRDWFAADPMLSTVKLSDPALVGGLNQILLDVPSYTPQDPA